MKAQLLLMAGGVVAGLGLGWFTAPAAEVEAAAAHQVAALAHARVETHQARERLESLGFAPPPVVDTGPPPPDIAILFRRDLTAIEQGRSGAIVWVVDLAQTHQRRALRVGDVYQDRWRVSRIEAQSVELRRRREVRTVSVFALPVSEP